MLRSLLIVLNLLLLAFAPAAVETATVAYREGETELEGFVAVDNSREGKRPGILIVHQWTGISDSERDVAKKLAGLGAVAFCADIYGKGVRPAFGDEAGAMAGKFKSDRALFRKRLIAALEELRRHPDVDPAQVSAIGYCFGGTAVLELARAGADVKAVVSFHGGLDSPTPADAANIKANVLVLHGADDPLVPKAEIEAFKKEMADGKVDWQMVYYGGAVHSFTDKGADAHNFPAAKYHADADRRSWQAMLSLFDEVMPLGGGSK